MDQMNQKPLQPHQQRVVEEKRELDEKIAKLDAFFLTPTFKNLPTAERGRLFRQKPWMLGYSKILGERIEAFNAQTT